MQNAQQKMRTPQHRVRVRPRNAQEITLAQASKPASGPGTHATARNPAGPKRTTPQSRFADWCARALRGLLETNPFGMPGELHAGRVTY